jgi:L-2-hydroxyglutarate oxidase
VELFIQEFTIPPVVSRQIFVLADCLRLLVYVRNFKIPYEQCGKLLVATNNAELARMQDLYKRCTENNVDSSLLTANELNSLEPEINGMGRYMSEILE